MESLNKVMLIGNVGKDPDIRKTYDGRDVANFVLATNQSWTDKDTGERRERTEWHRIACFNPGLVGVIGDYVKKGTKLYLEGQLHTRKWQDQEGQERYTTEVILQGFNCSLKLLSNYGRDENQEKEALVESNEPLPYNTKASNSPDYLNDDIPF